MTLTDDPKVGVIDPAELPIWRLTLPPEERESAHDVEVAGIPLAKLGDDLVGTLQMIARTVPVDGRFLLLVDRSVVRGFLDLLSQGRWRRRRSLRRRQLMRGLRYWGFEVLAEYDVWPSSETPRILVPHRSLPAVRWIRRSGVLGGGGRVLWKRAIARSPFMTVLAWAFCPASAILARRLR